MMPHPESTASSESAINLRHERYLMLFAGELPYNPKLDPAYAGVSGLCRATLRGRTRKPELKAHIEKLPGIINEALSEHDRDAKADGEALFAFRDKKSQEIITDATISVFTQWEVTHYIHGLPPLLANDNHNGKWLIAETAAAVAAVNNPYSGFNLLANTTDRKTAARTISCWGPNFSQEWTRGTILAEWAQGKGMSDEEKAKTFALYGLSSLKNAIRMSPKDPLGTIEQIKDNLEVTLTDRNIADELGWNIEEVQETFVPSIKKAIAYGNPKNPLAAVEKIKHNLEVVLVDENIANELGWSVEEVQELLAPSTRKRIAAGHPKNPLVAIQKIKRNLETTLSDESIAKETGWDLQKVQQVFTPSVRRFLAIHSIKNPIPALKKIKDNLETTLSDEGIAEHLDWETSKVKEIFTPGIRRDIAVYNTRKPLVAAQKIKDNLEIVLTDEKIAEKLGWSMEEVQEIFIPGIRKIIATGFTNNPLDGCQAWIDGQIKINASLAKTKDAKLKRLKELKSTQS